MTTNKRVPSAALLLLLLLVFATACDGGSTRPPPPPQMEIVYSAASTSPPANSISLSEVSRTSSSITLGVNANSVTDLYGIGFDLVWNPAFLSYRSASEGTFLASGGRSTTLVADLADTDPGPGVNREQGRLKVAVSRLGAVPGATGSGMLLSVVFDAVSAGTTGISFEATVAFDSTGAMMPISFSGGSVNVRR